MYENLSIDQLVEYSQEAADNEYFEITREIARRFREGIGVEVDLEEAVRWENGLVQDSNMSGSKQHQNEETESVLGNDFFAEYTEAANFARTV